jgi:Sulfotransferase domain
MKEVLDFIVIGAQKAGTTSLFEYLRRHPELSVPAGKEAPYFSHDDVWRGGWDNYMSQTFASFDPTRKWGTVTPQYMVGGLYQAAFTGTSTLDHDERTVPLRIRQRLPQVRLIAILRDPVERARSHHQMAVMNGFELRSFDEAIEELLRADSLAQSRAHPRETTGYVTWGEYGRILSGYLDVFPHEQVLVIFTEELGRSPEGLLRRVHEFLDVSPDFIPDNIGSRYRVGGAERRLSWLSPSEGRWPSPYGAVRRAVTGNRTARVLWRHVPEITRKRIGHGIEQGLYKLDLWNRRDHAPTAVNNLKPANLARLQTHFAQDADRLTALLGDVPPWLASLEHE